MNAGYGGLSKKRHLLNCLGITLQTTARCFWSPSQENQALRFSRLFCISLLEWEQSHRSENEWAKKQSREQPGGCRMCQSLCKSECALIPACYIFVGLSHTWEKTPGTWMEWGHHWYEPYFYIQTSICFLWSCCMQAKPGHFSVRMQCLETARERLRAWGIAVLHLFGLNTGLWGQQWAV